MSAVLDKDEADNLAVVYAPRKFPQSISTAAKDFVTGQKTGVTKEFRIDRINAEQTGVAELERVSVEQQVEKIALERIKEIQEQAYKEAHQLGLDEGREQAFQEAKAELDEHRASLSKLLEKIENMKMELVNANEAHLMKLLLAMASRIAIDEIKAQPETILKVLKQAVEVAQGDETITVKLSQVDFDFLNSVREKSGAEVEMMKRLKLEASADIQTGGCVIETNYGSVDATVEQRVSKLWETISEKIPKSKDVVG